MQKMKQQGTNSSSVPSALLCCLAIVCLCLAEGGQAEDQEVQGASGVATDISRSVKSGKQQPLRNDAAPYVGELSLGPHDNTLLEILNSTDQSTR
jgi:hypothetical protein